MLFQLVPHGIQLREHIWHRLFHRQGTAFRRGGLGQWQWRTNTGHDILALCVDQKFAIEHVLAGRRITGKRHTSGAIITHIAEYHRLNIHRSAPGGGNIIQPAIGNRTVIHPTGKDRPSRAP